jgi:hypothetical protein
MITKILDENSVSTIGYAIEPTMELTQNCRLQMRKEMVRMHPQSLPRKGGRDKKLSTTAIKLPTQEHLRPTANDSRENTAQKTTKLTERRE